MTEQELKAVLDEFKAGLPKGMSVEEVKTAIDNKFNELSKTIEGLTELKSIVDTMKSGIVELEGKMTDKTVEVKSPVDMIVSEIKKLGVNNIEELKSYVRKNGNQTLELKAISAIATSAITGDIGRTNMDTMVRWTPTVADAFLPVLRNVAEDSARDYFGYIEGSYTGTAGYVGEGVGTVNSDSAVAEEKTGKYAKIQSVLTVNSEVYETLPDFAAGLLNQMNISMRKFADDEAYTGDGLAPAGVQHIKGLKSYATEFDATDFSRSVEDANIADLIDAMATAISIENGGYSANAVFINPMDFFKLRKLKDGDGQPLMLTDAMGNSFIGNSGLRIFRTKKITADTLLVADLNVAELRTKRAMTLKVGQILADDVLNDKQSAVLMARYQILVRDLDKVAILKCSEVANTIAIINKSQA